MTEGSGEDSDKRKLDWIKENSDGIRMAWDEYVKDPTLINALNKLGRIEDLRPSKNGNYIFIEKIPSFPNIIDVLYQIRCNFFHGGKSPNQSRDREFVEIGCKILRMWMQILVFAHD
jgi:hypothetical protein